jgi:4'-phosphopantetheinyl transferase
MRRALLFHFDRDAAMFVARRGIMRLILATYTGILPADIKFAYNQFGKPALESRVHDVRFSVSQSGDLAIYALPCTENSELILSILDSPPWTFQGLPL